MNFRNSFEFMEEGGEGDLESNPNQGQMKATPQDSIDVVADIEAEYNKLGNQGTALVGQGQDAVKDVAGDVKREAGQLANQAKNIATGQVNNVKNKANALANRGVDNAKEVANNAKQQAIELVDTGKAAVGQVKDSLVNARNELIDTTKNAMDDVKNEAQKDVDELINEADDLVNGVTNNAKDKALELANLGKQNAADVANLAVDRANQLNDQAHDLVDNTKAAIMNNANKLKDGANNAMNSVEDGAQDQINAIEGEAQGLLDDVQGEYDDIKLSAQKTMDALKDPNEVASNCFACAADMGSEALENKGMECKVFAFAGIIVKGDGMINMFDYEAQFKRAKTMGQSFVEDIKGEAEGAVHGLEDMGQTFVEKAQENALAVVDDAEDMGQELVEDAQDRAQHIADEAQDLGAKIADEAKDKANNIANNAQNFAASVAQEAQDKAQNIAHNAEDFAANTAADAKKMAAKQAQRAQDFAKNTAANAQNTVQGIADKSKNYASNTVANAQNAVNNVAQEAKDYGQDMADSSKQLAQNVTQDAQNFAAKTAQDGKSMASGIANNAKNFAAKTAADAKGMANKIKNEATDLAQSVQNDVKDEIGQAKSLANKLETDGKNMATKDLNMAKNLVNDAKKDATNLVGDAKGMATKDLNMAKNLVNDAKKDATNLIGDAKGMATKDLNMAKNLVNDAKQDAGNLVGQAKSMATKDLNMAKNLASDAQKDAGNLIGEAKNMASKDLNSAKNVASDAQNKAGNLSGQAGALAEKAGQEANEMVNEAKKKAASQLFSKVAKKAANMKQPQDSAPGGFQAEGGAREDAQNMASDAQKDASQLAGQASNVASGAKQDASKLAKNAQNDAKQLEGEAKNIASTATADAKKLANAAKGDAKQLVGEAKNIASTAKADAMKLKGEAENDAKQLVGEAKNIASTAKADAMKLKNEAVNDAKQLVGEAKNIASTAKADAMKLKDEAVNGVKNLAGTAKKDAIKDYNKAKNLTFGAAEDALNLGSNTIAGAKGLAQGSIKDASNYAKNTMAGADQLATNTVNQTAALGMKGLDGAKDLAVDATNQFAGVGKDALKGAGDLASGAVDDMAGLGKDTINGARDLATGAMGDATELGKNTMKGAGKLANGAIDDAADLGKHTMNGAKDLATGAINDMGDLAGDAMAGAGDLAADAADQVGELGNDAMAKSAALANKSMARFGTMGTDAIGDVRNVGKTFVGDLTKSATNAFSDTRSLLTGGNEMWVRRVAEKVQKATKDIKVNGTKQSYWELLKEATLWNSGASYKTAAEIAEIKAKENEPTEESEKSGEEDEEKEEDKDKKPAEAPEEKEKEKSLAEGGENSEKSESFESEEISSDDPFDDRIVANRVPTDLRLYGDKMDASFVKFFKSVSSIGDVWKFQKQLDNQVKVLYQRNPDEDDEEKISIIAVENSDPDADDDAKVRVYVKGTWEDLEEAVTGFLSAKGSVKDVEDDDLGMPEFPADDDTQAEGGDQDDQNQSESDSQFDDPTEWVTFVENITEYARHHNCAHQLVVCYKDMSQDEFDDIKDDLTGDDFDSILDDLVAICMFGLEEAEDLMSQCFTGINKCLTKSGISPLKKVDPNSEEGKIRRAQQAILADIWDLKNSKDAKDCCHKCKPLIFKICKLNPYAKAPAMMHTSDGSEDHANWASVVMGTAILILLIYLLILNFNKIGSIQNISMESYSADLLPKMGLNAQAHETYGILDNIYNLTGNITVEQQSYMAVDARLPIYEREIQGQNFAPRVQIQFIKDPENKTGLPGQKDFCGCWFNCQGADGLSFLSSSGAGNLTAIYEGRFHYGVTELGSWATSTFVNNSFVIDMYKNYAKQGSITATLQEQTENVLNYMTTTNDTFLPKPLAGSQQYRLVLTGASQSSRNATRQEDNFLPIFINRIDNFSSDSYYTNDDASVSYWKTDVCTNTQSNTSILQWEKYDWKELQIVEKVELLPYFLADLYRPNFNDLEVYVGETLCGKYPSGWIPAQWAQVNCPEGTVGNFVKLMQKNQSLPVQTCGIKVYGQKPNHGLAYDINSQKYYTQEFGQNTSKIPFHRMPEEKWAEKFVGNFHVSTDPYDRKYIAQSYGVVTVRDIKSRTRIKARLISENELRYDAPYDNQGLRAEPGSGKIYMFNISNQEVTGYLYKDGVVMHEKIPIHSASSSTNKYTPEYLEGLKESAKTNNDDKQRLFYSQPQFTASNTLFKKFDNRLCNGECSNFLATRNTSIYGYENTAVTYTFTINQTTNLDAELQTCIQDHNHTAVVFEKQFECKKYTKKDKGKLVVQYEDLGCWADVNVLTMGWDFFNPNIRKQVFPHPENGLNGMNFQSCMEKAIQEGSDIFAIQQATWCYWGKSSETWWNYKEKGPSDGCQWNNDYANSVYQIKNADTYFSPFNGENSCLHTPGIDSEEFAEYYFPEKYAVHTVRILNRADAYSERTYGVIVYADDQLCGTFPEFENGWFTVDCKGAWAKKIKIKQPLFVQVQSPYGYALEEKKEPLTICGVEAYGEPVETQPKIGNDQQNYFAFSNAGSFAQEKFDKGVNYAIPYRLKGKYTVQQCRNAAIAKGWTIYAVSKENKDDTEYICSIGNDELYKRFGKVKPTAQEQEILDKEAAKNQNFISFGFDFATPQLAQKFGRTFTYDVYKINYQSPGQNYKLFAPDSFSMRDNTFLVQKDQEKIKDYWSNAETQGNSETTGELSNLFDGQYQWQYGSGSTRWANQDQLRPEVCINLKKCTSINNIKTYQYQNGNAGVNSIVFYLDGQQFSRNMQANQDIQGTDFSAIIPQQFQFQNLKSKYLKFKVLSGYDESNAIIMQELAIVGDQTEGCEQPIPVQFLDKAKTTQANWKINTFFSECLITSAFAGQTIEFELVSQTGVDTSYANKKLTLIKDGDQEIADTLLLDFTDFPCLQDIMKIQYNFSGLPGNQSKVLYSPSFDMNVVGCKAFDASPLEARAEYQGCFRDQAQNQNAVVDPLRTYEFGIKGTQPYTVETCLEEAVKRGYKNFGIQKTNWCWVGCGNKRPTATSFECTAENEGGDLANSVYDVSLPASKNPLYSLNNDGCYELEVLKEAATNTNAFNVNIDPDWASMQLEGCFINKEVEPFSIDGIMASGMGRGYNIDSCKTAAVEKGYNTFAMQDGDYCLVGCNSDFTQFGQSGVCQDGKGGDKAANVYTLTLPHPQEDGYRIVDGCYRQYLNDAIKPPKPYLVNQSACTYGDKIPKAQKNFSMGSCAAQKFNPFTPIGPILESGGSVRCDGYEGLKIDFNDTLEIDYSRICAATNLTNITAVIRFRNKVLNPSYRIGWIVPGNDSAVSNNKLFIDRWVEMASIDICNKDTSSVSIDAYLTIDLIEKPATQAEGAAIQNGLMSKQMFVLFNYNKQEQEVKVTRSKQGSKIKVDMRVQHSAYTKTNYFPQTVSFFFNEAGALIAVHTAAAGAMLAGLMATFNGNEVKEQLKKELKEKHPKWTDEQIEAHITPAMIEKKVIEMKKQVSFKGIAGNAKQLDEGQKDVAKLNKVMSDLDKANGDLKDKLKQVQDEAAKQQQEIKEKLDQLRAENEALKKKAGQ